MSSELPPQNPDFTIQEERLQYGAEKKKQRGTARLIWASKPRKEPSPKDLEFQTAEIVIPNKATGNLSSFFETEKKEIDSQPNRLIWGDNLLGYRKLVILAWDYEFDFDNDFSRLKANKKEIADCEFKVIPSDVLKYLRKTGVNGGSLADKITFYQKPYLRMGEPTVRQQAGDTLAVRVVDVFGNDASVTKELDLR